MKTDSFPIYSVLNLKKSLQISLNSMDVDLDSIGLENIKVLSDNKFLENGDVDLNVIFGETSIDIKGEVLHYIYDRDTRRYCYTISTRFSTKKSFLKWLALIKGIHKARFKV